MMRKVVEVKPRETIAGSTRSDTTVDLVLECGHETMLYLGSRKCSRCAAGEPPVNEWERFLKLLTASDTRVRVEALSRVLMGEHFESAFAVILQQARSEDPRCRYDAVWFLSRLTEIKDGAIDTLAAATKDTWWYVRLEALQALSKWPYLPLFSRYPHLVFDPVKEAIHDPNPLVKLAAIRAVTAYAREVAGPAMAMAVFFELADRLKKDVLVNADPQRYRTGDLPVPTCRE